MEDAPPILLPWERLLWRGEPAFPRVYASPLHYLLTDVRLVRMEGEAIDEVALSDIVDVQRTESAVERLFGLSTLVVRTTRPRGDFRLAGVRRGDQLAALLELVAGEAAPAVHALDAESVLAALAWEPAAKTGSRGEGFAGVLLVVVAAVAVTVGFHRRQAAPPALREDDPIISATGERRPQAEIVRFMEHDVMPWARTALGPIKGGSDRISCQTCHGADAVARGWSMPAVAALPQPDLRQQGWEQYGGALDAQMRNAIYGYLAESDKQERAAYMREVVMPGMARLLERPPYDFTQPYGYNRSRQAFGCYHCHRVK